VALGKRYFTDCFFFALPFSLNRQYLFICMNGTFTHLQFSVSVITMWMGCGWVLGVLAAWTMTSRWADGKDASAVRIQRSPTNQTFRRNIETGRME
jgi:hypothetical protein